ncbi:hypothetical protein D3C83_218570 [compost metagenome]
MRSGNVLRIGRRSMHRSMTRAARSADTMNGLGPGALAIAVSTKPNLKFVTATLLDRQASARLSRYDDIPAFDAA